MKRNLAIVVNTHSSMKDLWIMFVKQFEKFFPNQKIYFLCDIEDSVFSKYNFLKYKKSDDFTSQYLKSLKKIKEKYIITLNEDYILYDFVNKKKIKSYIEILNKNKKYLLLDFTKVQIVLQKNLLQIYIF